MPVTMKDIARRAGVSIRTVSRVVNAQGEISDETMRHVQALIDEMGYRPNQMARGLVSKRSNSIGLVVPNISNSFYPEIAQAVQFAARARRHNMLLCSHENSADEQQLILESLESQGVDGIIIFPARNSNDKLIRFAEKYVGCVVVVNHTIDHPKLSLVQANIEHGAYQAVDYLVHKGHTRIGMINALRSPEDRRWREKGFTKGMMDNGLSFPECYLVPGDVAESDIDGGEIAALTLLTQNPEVSAIFCYNDMMAIGAIRACQKLTRRVPDACAIVGFDDIAMATIVQPALTTMRIDKTELGSSATLQLLAMLQSDNLNHGNIVLETVLVIRQSA